MPSILFDRNRTSKKTQAAPKASPLRCGSLQPTNQSTNMSTALNNNSTRSTVPGTVAISDDEMRRFAPSVFASQPIEGVSERYSFLPTSSILNGMRENGWVPVRAQEQSIRTEARRGFQKHVVRFARVEHLQTWEKNQVRPEVVLVKSHDKSSAYQLHCRPVTVRDKFTGSRRGGGLVAGRRPSRGRAIGTYRFRYAPLLPPVRLGPP